MLKYLYHNLDYMIKMDHYFTHKGKPVMTVAKSDKGLLNALQENCRSSSNDLANRANMSTATCWRKQKSLEEVGIITGYRAVLDREKLGYNVCVFTHVSIERQSSDIVENIEKELIKHPSIMECYTATGDADIVLRVIAKDMNDYDQFLNGFIFKLHGITHVRSNITLRELKQTTQVPL